MMAFFFHKTWYIERKGVTLQRKSMMNTWG